MPDKRERKLGPAEEETNVINVSLGSITTMSDPTDKDAFASGVSEVRKYLGLSPQTKRRFTRDIQKFRRGTDGAESKALTEEEINGYNLFEVISPPYNLSYLAALFEKSSPHAAAVKAKVNNIVGLGYAFVESELVKQEIEDVEGDEKRLSFIRRKLNRGRRQLEEWIESCNEEDTFEETLKKAWTDYETTGNGYIEVGRKNTGQIGYIGHVPSPTMRVRRDRDGFVQIISNRTVFFRNFGDQETKDPVGNDPYPNEIIHIKKYTPTSSYYGVPDVIASMNSIAGNELASKFNLDYFENKAVPRYVVVVKGATLSPASEKQILEFFHTSMKGKNHRTLYVPLPSDADGNKISFEMKPIETGIQDASFENYRKGNLQEILMAHGVPLSKVSSVEGASLAAARDADKTFKEQVCRPEQEVFEKKLNRIIKEVSNVFRIHLNELSLTDEDTQSRIDERYLRLKTYTPNEVRARKSMAGIPGGDQPVELRPQDAAEQRAQALASRGRDSERSANSSDAIGEGRNTQGDGRRQQ